MWPNPGSPRAVTNGKAPGQLPAGGGGAAKSEAVLAPRPSRAAGGGHLYSGQSLWRSAVAAVGDTAAMLDSGKRLASAVSAARLPAEGSSGRQAPRDGAGGEKRSVRATEAGNSGRVKEAASLRWSQRSSGVPARDSRQFYVRPGSLTWGRPSPGDWTFTWELTSSRDGWDAVSGSLPSCTPCAAACGVRVGASGFPVPPAAGREGVPSAAGKLGPARPHCRRSPPEALSHCLPQPSCLSARSWCCVRGPAGPRTQGAPGTESSSSDGQPLFLIVTPPLLSLERTNFLTIESSSGVNKCSCAVSSLLHPCGCSFLIFGMWASPSPYPASACLSPLAGSPDSQGRLQVLQ
ncbi:Hypothetical predicted protein [Marmota monax]|uniref:Uncharacterized protein n=1 Tax=Marmota monax TaxID=9995 RepID=A0A5E4CK80_MARMO|nr:Hypothetical predicted protein [Marmota monax]